MNFQCPYCGNHSTITDPNSYENWDKIDISKSIHWENIWFWFDCITCPNKDCNQLILNCYLTKATKNWYWVRSSKIQNRNLLPDSIAKVLPDYIPQAISEDYYEACRIKNLSPKASATLSRRCLQWMIRDFHRVSLKKTLKQEIESIKDIIETDTREAIDAVRTIWNIWAHMEKDINTIIDVDPNEAQLLIELIELLIQEWYITRHKRQENTKKIIEIAKEKNSQKQ